MSDFLNFFYSLSVLETILLSLLVSTFLISLWYILCSFLRGVLSAVKVDKGAFVAHPISIIIILKGEIEFLQKGVHTLFNQEYEGEFEVVIVNFTNSDSEIEYELKMLQERYSNLYVTSLTTDRRQTTKLGYLLGIKGAKFDKQLFVLPAGQILSNKWLSTMARGFNNSNIVTGYSSIPSQKSVASKIISCQNALDSLTCIGSIAVGNPYLINRFNMGYDRQVVLKSGGISHHPRFDGGEDDFLVQAASKISSVSVVLDPLASIKIDYSESLQIHKALRNMRLYSRRFYPLSVKFYLFFESFHKPLLWLSAIGLLIFASQPLKIVAASLILIRLILFTIIFLIFAKKSGEKVSCIDFLLYEATSTFSDISTSIYNTIRPNSKLWI